jgi:hypothetical protein
MVKTGMMYISQRLLSNQASISPRLDNIRRIATRLSREHIEDDTRNLESYTAYINRLSELLVFQDGNKLVRGLFANEPPIRLDEMDNDLFISAAYSGHLSIIQELHESKAHATLTEDVYMAAALDGQVAIIDHSLSTIDSHTLEEIRCILMLCVAAKSGNLKTV